MPSQAQEADFTGETVQGGFTEVPGEAPALTPEQLAEARARKKAWLAAQGLDENGNPLPAYGTPRSQGGTATGFEVASQPVGASGNVGEVWTTALGSNDVAQPGAAINEYTYTGGRQPVVNEVGAIVPGADLVGSMAQTPGLGSQAGMQVSSGGEMALGGTHPGATTGGVPGGASRGGQLSLQTAQGTADLRDAIEADRVAATDAFSNTMSDVASGDPLQNAALTQTAGNQARSALGPAPTIDQGLADRGLGAVTDATRQAGQVVDRALQPVDQTAVNAAMGSARDVLDRALNGPDTAARIGSQTLRNQLALARSAAGGAGAVQQALGQAQAAAPELLAQAADAGTREQLAKLGVASQQTGQLTQGALGQQQAETQRIGAAAQAAGTSAQAAQGARGQDIDIAARNLASADNLLNNVAQITGQQLQLSVESKANLGRMASDLLKTGFDWSQLDAQTQDAEFERWIKTYGIDVAAAAQIKAAAENNDKGVMDYLVPIIGSVAGLGAAAL